jgi:hypothetical protein
MEGRHNSHEIAALSFGLIGTCIGCLSSFAVAILVLVISVWDCFANCIDPVNHTGDSTIEIQDAGWVFLLWIGVLLVITLTGLAGSFLTMASPRWAIRLLTASAVLGLGFTLGAYIIAAILLAISAFLTRKSLVSTSNRGYEAPADVQ